MNQTPRVRRSSAIALLIAAVCSAGLLVAGFVAPVYQAVSSSSSGRRVESTDTLVGVNGLGAVPVLAVPLLITVLVTWALLQRGRRWAMPLAWTLTAILGVFTLLAMMTIGILVLPVTVALLVACAKGPEPASQVAA